MQLEEERLTHKEEIKRAGKAKDQIITELKEMNQHLQSRLANNTVSLLFKKFVPCLICQ